MVDSPPVVYLLHGEDEFAISHFISEIESRMGDPATASMNTTRLDGRTVDIDELPSVTAALPFLAKRRLVILSNPLARLTSQELQEKFLAQLKEIPPSTALVLIEYHPLTSEKDRRKGKLNWLEKWALEHKDRVYLKAFPLPRGISMVRWIIDQAGRSGGEITQQAAEHLASLIDGDPRLADQEIRKLLAYVNYQRPVEVDDVETLTADASQGNIFAMVDSLSVGDGRRALGMLRRLLEYQDHISIFGMIVRQFRLLLLTREMLDEGKQTDEIVRTLGVASFVGEKLLLQARRFSLPWLESTYHRLLEVDEAMKTSQMPGDLALETFVAGFTTESEPLWMTR